MQSPSPPQPSQKESKSHKWAASPDEHTSTKKSHISGLATVSDVASALHKMASSFNDVDNGDPSTPQRWLMAICAVEKDQELNGEERIKAMHLFKRDIAATDSYLAISDSTVCAEIIHLEIEDF
jgi:hypothetical protein